MNEDKKYNLQGLCEALNILVKYDPEFCPSLGPDILFAASSDCSVSDEDRRMLINLGWEERYGMWIKRL